MPLEAHAQTHAEFEQLRNQVQALTDRVAVLEETNRSLQGIASNEALQELAALAEFVRIDRDRVSEMAGPHIFFEGANVHIRSGTGSTADTSGLGNLVVGYNELPVITPARTGSHNLIIGPEHNYPSFGGFVAGTANNIEGENATVSGGRNNTASGNRSSVSGGAGNTANGLFATVSAGIAHITSGEGSSVSGGAQNTASGARSSVSGGRGNTAIGEGASVSGGSGSEARGDFASVSGGFQNTASGSVASVSGGRDNEASGITASVIGGAGNRASGDASIAPRRF